MSSRSRDRSDSSRSNSSSTSSRGHEVRLVKHGSAYERLWDAVGKQDKSEVEKLLRKMSRGSRIGSSAKLSVLQPGFYKGKLTSHLHLAALSGLTDIVKLLLEADALIDARDQIGNTPLLCAASQRHWQCVKLLLDSGANPLLCNQNSTSILHYVVVTGEAGDLDLQLRLVASCLESGCPINAKDSYGDSPLIFAAVKGQLEMCSCLLENGARVNQANNFGETPLHKAVLLGNLHLAMLFLDMGANPLIVSKRGKPRDLLGASGQEEESLLYNLLVGREESFVDTSAISLGEATDSRMFDETDWHSLMRSSRPRSGSSSTGSVSSRKASSINSPMEPQSPAEASPSHSPRGGGSGSLSGRLSGRHTVGRQSNVGLPGLAVQGGVQMGGASNWSLRDSQAQALGPHHLLPPSGSGIGSVQHQRDRLLALKSDLEAQLEVVKRSLAELDAQQVVASLHRDVHTQATVSLPLHETTSFSSTPVAAATSSSSSFASSSSGMSAPSSAERIGHRDSSLWRVDSEAADNFFEPPPSSMPHFDRFEQIPPRHSSLPLPLSASQQQAQHSSALVVSRSSPSVERVLRKSSAGSDMEVMTLDAAYRQELTGYGQLDDMEVTKTKEVYRTEFWEREHSVFLSHSGVACVLHAESKNSFLVLALGPSGYSRLSIPAGQTHKDFAESCMQWLSINLWPDAEVVWQCDDDALKHELLAMEETAPENSFCFRVGVVNAQAGDTDESQMFEHGMTEKFSDFLDLISSKIDLMGWGGYRGGFSATLPGTSYYTSFHGCEVMFHVSSLLDAEQKRRLLGNDTVVVYFHDSDGEPFPSHAPRSSMSQVFVVVRPIEGGRKLKVGFMSRKKVVEYGPTLPMNPAFDVTTSVGRALFRDFLLCRIINAYRAAVVSPPLDQMLRRPRAVALEDLIKRYPVTGSRKKFAFRKKSALF